MAWVYLGLAIVAEIIATSALQATQGFSKLWPSVLTLAGYALAFYFLSLTLRSIPLGIAYAIWSGVGIVCVSIIAYFLYKQSLDLPAILGMSMIVGGVVIINLFSKSVAHEHWRAAHNCIRVYLVQSWCMNAFRTNAFRTNVSRTKN